MHTPAQILERISKCNEELIKLLDDKKLSKWLLKFRIRYWEYQIKLAETLLSKYDKLERLLSKEV